MKFEKIMYILIGLVLIMLIVIRLNMKEKKDLNYITKEENGIINYIIEEKTYIESQTPTDLVKISVKDKGIMIAELYPNIAPISVENYKKLVNEKFYNNLIFHRVIKDFMIQTGAYTSDDVNEYSETIKGEFSDNGIKNDLSHTRGVLSMARRGSNPETEETMNSASSQFFIVHQDSTFLDGKYAAFGKVIHGLELIDYVANTKTNESDKPVEDIIIDSITFVVEI